MGLETIPHPPIPPSWVVAGEAHVRAALATWRDLVLAGELLTLPRHRCQWGEHHGDATTRTRLERWAEAELEHPHARHDEGDVLRPSRFGESDIPDIGGETW